MLLQCMDLLPDSLDHDPCIDEYRRIRLASQKPAGHAGGQPPADQGARARRRRALK